MVHGTPVRYRRSQKGPPPMPAPHPDTINVIFTETFNRTIRLQRRHSRPRCDRPELGPWPTQGTATGNVRVTEVDRLKFPYSKLHNPGPAE